MKCIQAPTQMVRAVLQKPVIPGTYRRSCFAYLLEHDGAHLAFHTMTHAFYELNETEWALLSQETAELPAENAEPLAELIDAHFFVPESENETQSYMELFELLRLTEKRKAGMSFYKIFTTLECNARCFYCFEPDHSTLPMTPETVADVFAYIMKTKREGEIVLYWFGGEPLCNAAAIDQLTSMLDEAGVSYKSTMVSNGYLFTPELIRHARDEWKLKKVQITLDGMDEEHNKRKRYRDPCENPFARTIENIQGLLDGGIAVSVRVNVDSHNVESVWSLIDYLAERFGGRKGFSAYPALLFEEFFKWKDLTPSESRRALRKEWLKMRTRMEELGFLKIKPIEKQMPMIHCMSNSPHSAIINYDGALFACQNCQADMAVGTVRDGITKPALHDKWMNNTRVREKCVDCRFLPQCTAFDMCPSLSSDCEVEQNDRLMRKLICSYQLFREANA